MNKLSLDVDRWRQVGEIARETLKYISSQIRAGAPVLDICEKIEDHIRSLGAKPAFPANISINEVAAHYTSPPGDKLKIPTQAVVKVDIGAISETGEISDTAITIGINVDKHVVAFIKSAQEVLYEAISIVKEGLRVGEIGRKIWQEAHKRGYGVLVDLGGHSISNWSLHAGITIPNVHKRYTPKLKAGMIIAIEPFLVYSSSDSYTQPDYNNIHIFSIKHVASRVIEKNKILNYLYKKFKHMPFALRWLNISTNNLGTYSKLQNYLIQKYYDGLIQIYPALIEVKGNLVAQFEHTLLVRQNSAEILTG